jgi:hypothetical protein
MVKESSLTRIPRTSLPSASTARIRRKPSAVSAPWVEEFLSQVLRAAARPNFREFRPETRTRAVDDVATAATPGFEDSTAPHGIAMGGARCHMRERTHVSRDLQEFVIVELPCAKHPGALDAFANYRYQFLVVDGVPETGNRQIGAFASPTIDPMTRRTLGFKKPLAVGYVGSCQ